MSDLGRRPDAARRHAPAGRWARLRLLTAQLAKFGVVGGLGFVVDVGVFNLLLLHPAAVPAWPMVAKTVSTGLAILVNWMGNRLWTFREHRRADTVREGVEFFLASILGSSVSLLCLGVSHYLLQLTSTFDDNMSANVVGLLLGSAVRFVAYRWWVFAEPGQSAGESGRVSVTVAPSPGRLSRLAPPPASAESLATMARPSPPPE
ncbi:MAG: GtrA family protein [Microbacterium sp.]